MKTASRILGSAFFLADYEVQDAPRYGAERRGAPIFAYVRASRQLINERGIIGQPDLVVVADDSLVSLPAAGVLQGLREHTVMLINSHDDPEVWKDRLNTAATVLILPAMEDSEDRADLPFVGTAWPQTSFASLAASGLKATSRAWRSFIVSQASCSSKAVTATITPIPT